MGYSRYIGVFAVVTALYNCTMAQQVGELMRLRFKALQSQLKCTFHGVQCSLGP